MGANKKHIVFLSLGCLFTGVLSATDGNCKLTLAAHARLSSQLTPTLRNGYYVKLANGLRVWRGDDTPAHVSRDQSEIALLEENLLYGDRLDKAVYQVKRHIEAVEFSYVLIKHHIIPMREIFSGLIKKLSASKESKLSETEIAELGSSFLGVGKAFAETSSYSILGSKKRAVKSIKLLEEMLTSRGEKEVSRKEVLKALQKLEGWLNGLESVYAKAIGRHITTYEMLKGYLDSRYEDRHLAYTTRTENVDEINPATKGLGLESVSATATDAAPKAKTEETPEYLLARKTTWERNRDNLLQRVGWRAEISARFSDLENVEAPTLLEIKQYYNLRHDARLAHNRTAAGVEAWSAFVTQISDILAVDSVLRPAAKQIATLATPSGRQRLKQQLVEWSLNVQSSLILKEIQEFVETPGETVSKASNLAIYAANPKVGPYFLRLFASYSDIKARILWREIHAYTKTDGSLYPDLGKMMDTANEAAVQSGVPVSIHSVQWVIPSRIAAYTLWVTAYAFYNFYGDEGEELDDQVAEQIKEEVEGVVGSVQEVIPPQPGKGAEPTPPTPETPVNNPPNNEKQPENEQRPAQANPAPEEAPANPTPAAATPEPTPPPPANPPEQPAPQQ